MKLHTSVPNFVARLAGLGFGVEGPDEFAGVGVPCAHRFDAIFAFDDQIVIDDGRSGGADAVDEAAGAKTFGGLAGFCV
jgi:hypothetical protein